jgi:hypothetical protein
MPGDTHFPPEGDDILRRNVSSVAWPRTAYTLLILAALAFIPLVRLDAPAFLAMSAVLVGLAWHLLHGTRKVVTFDGASRQLHFADTRWLHFRPEPAAPTRLRTIAFHRIRDFPVETGEDEDAGTYFTLYVLLRDGEKIELASERLPGERALRDTAHALIAFVHGRQD